MNYLWILAFCLCGGLATPITKDETLPDEMATELDIVEEKVDDPPCYYYLSGTAPFCKGKCQSNEFMNYDGNGHLCWTGDKVECSNCAFEAYSIGEGKCIECKPPEGVETYETSKTSVSGGKGRSLDSQIYLSLDSI